MSITPPPHKPEAYIYVIPPSAKDFHNLTSHADAFWGSSVEGAVSHGMPMDMFNLSSIGSFVIFRSGGPLIWKYVRQDDTSQSFCEAEIRATNKCTK